MICVKPGVYEPLASWALEQEGCQSQDGLERFPGTRLTPEVEVEDRMNGMGEVILMAFRVS